MRRLLHTTDGWISFYCPGCKCSHGIPVKGPRGWTFNGNDELPTIIPSILVNVGGANPEQPICHSFVTNGDIIFLSDCTHELAGKTVVMEDADA